MVLNVKYKGKPLPNVNYITSTYSPTTLSLSGMLAIVNINKNNNCKIIIDNWAPYDVKNDRNNILGIIDLETHQLIPIEDSVISSLLKDIKEKLPKVPKKKLKKEDILLKAHLDMLSEYKQKYDDILFKHLPGWWIGRHGSSLQMCGLGLWESYSIIWKVKSSSRWSMISTLG